MERHPQLKEEDVRAAWNGAFVSQARVAKNPNEYVALGFDKRARLVEMVAVRLLDGSWSIFRATTPPSERTLRELKMKEA